MYTFCHNEDWESENFDFDWCLNENGRYATPEEADAAGARVYGTGMFTILRVD